MRTTFFKKSMAAALITSLVIVGFSSCKKYLDVKPLSSATTDYAFSTVDNATKAVLGAYASMTGDNGYGIRLNMYYPYDNDEMIGQQGQIGDGERRDIAHYNATPANTQLYSPYSQLYQGIERANICIYYIPQMDLYKNGSDIQKSQLQRLYGEALTLRAQFYLELIRNWGDVVEQRLPSAFETDLFKAKTDRDTIYEHILDDLATAETIVPWRSQVPLDERITQGAVRGLRARIALYRAGYSLRSDGQMKQGSDPQKYYQIAREECQTIINSGEHSLDPSYIGIWRDHFDAHTIDAQESIWEVAMGGSNNSKLGYYNGPRWNGKGNSALRILPNYFYLFDSTDTRRDVTIAPYNINADLTLVAVPLTSGLFDGKFRRDWTSNPSFLTSAAQNFSLNWPLIRYADILLMFAEAENELNGPTSAAYDAVNMVRRRGYGLPINTPSPDVDLPSGLSKTDFFNAIVKERALEFGSEGIRKYDLIRWNLLAQKIAETKAILTAMASRQPPYDQLPENMYYKVNEPTLIWAGSFYNNNVTSAPSSDYKGVAWIASGITSGLITNMYAVNFQTGKSELLPFPTKELESNPKLTQNPGY
jgi:hypothetical protein